MSEPEALFLSEAQIDTALLHVQTLLGQVGEQMAASRERLSRGETIAVIYGIAEELTEFMYAVAYQLAHTERAGDGLSVALWLTAVQPADARFHVIAGLFLQQLGQTDAACRFYAQSLLLNDQDAGAIYRLAECLWIRGDKAEARRLFDAVIDLGRDDSALLALQQASQHRLTLH